MLNGQQTNLSSSKENLSSSNENLSPSKENPSSLKENLSSSKESLNSLEENVSPEKNKELLQVIAALSSPEDIAKSIKLLKGQKPNTLSGVISSMTCGVVGGAIYDAIVSNWSTISSALVSVAEAIVAAGPVIGIVVGSITAVGVALFCVYEIYKHREKIKEGAKYIGEKTIDGAKVIKEKTVEGVETLVGGVKKGYEHSTDSLKRGARRVGSITSYDKEKHGNYLDRITDEITPEERNKAKEIAEQLKAEAKGDKSVLVESILDGIAKIIGDKIADKKKDEASSADELILVSKLELQKEFIEDLKSRKLKILVDGPAVPKDYFLMTKTFSEHYDEIKEVIKNCKEEHTRFSSLERLNKAAKTHGTVRKDSSRQTSLSEGGGIADSTAGSDVGLLDPTQHKKVESQSLFSLLKAKIPSFRRSNSASYNVAEYERLSNASTPIQTLSRSNSMTGSTSSFSEFQDSGIGSDSGHVYATVKRSRSSTPSTPVKVSSPVVPESAPKKPPLEVSPPVVPESVKKPPRTYASDDSGRSSPDVIIQIEPDSASSPSRSLGSIQAQAQANTEHKAGAP